MQLVKYDLPTGAATAHDFGPGCMPAEGVFVPAGERAEILSALEPVDYVIVFSEPTVERLLLLLTPDVHCKGPDYTVGSVPERGVVQSYGGVTVIVGDEKHHSSRDLVARLPRG